jgi:transcriptional regulator with XRE-family HTH domain
LTRVARVSDVGMSDVPRDTSAAHRIYRAFGARVKSERDAVGMTQEELATAVGLSRSSIANIERGTQAVSLDALYRIASALDRDPAELLPSREEAGLVLDVDPDLVRGFENSPAISDWLSRVATRSESE